MRVVKKIPTTENGARVHCTTESGEEYYITQCRERFRFTLWHKVDSGYEEVATAKDPVSLDEQIPWDE